MSNKPLVSIIINNYNYGLFISDAIDSALNQTYPKTEVIVVDDGSTDNSKEVIANYGNKIIALFKENGGQASALNAGFKASKGDIICLLDADDLFVPEKVSEVVKMFQLDKDVNWVFVESAPFESTYLNNKDLSFVLNTVFNGNSDESIAKIDFRKNIRNAELPDFTPSTSNLCFSRSILEEIFPLPEVGGFSGLAICDTYLNLVAVGLGTGYASKKNLGIFRRHNKNLYTTQEFSRRRKVFAEIFVVTAYFIKINFPQFKKLSKKLFSRGFSNYLMSQSKIPSCETFSKKYFSDLTIKESFEVKTMILYYRLKMSFIEYI